MKTFFNIIKQIAISIIFVCLFYACQQQSSEVQEPVQKENPEKVAIKNMMGIYFKAFDNYDTATLKTLFEPDAKIINIYTDSIKEFHLKDWLADYYSIKFIPEHPWNTEKSKKEIVYLDIFENSATANVEWVYSEYKYIEYYNLQKLDDKWVIMNRQWNATKFGYHNPNKEFNN